MMYSVSHALMQRSQRIKGQELVAEVVEDKIEGENGLVRLRVRDLHEGWEDKHLPLAKPRSGFGSGDGTITEVFVPPKGTLVYVDAEDESNYHFNYRSGPNSDDKKNKEFTDKEVYPYAHGHEDAGGNLTKTVTKEGSNTQTWQHQSGATYHIDNDGNVSISAAEGKDVVLNMKTFTVNAEDVVINGKKTAKIVSEATQVHSKMPLELRTKMLKSPPLVPTMLKPEDAPDPTYQKARTRPTPKMTVASKSGGSGGSASA